MRWLLCGRLPPNYIQGEEMNEWKQLFEKVREVFEKTCEFTDRHTHFNKYLGWINLALLCGIAAFVTRTAATDVMPRLQRSELAWHKAHPKPKPPTRHQVIDIAEPIVIKGNSMGAHSTLLVSRKAALRKIMMELLDASDEQLEEVLYRVWGDDKLYNFTIGGEDKDDSVLE